VPHGVPILYHGGNATPVTCVAKDPDQSGFGCSIPELRIRSEEFARETAQNLKRFFDDTAPRSVIDLFSKHLA
jgi:hypothetical protein